MNKEVLYYFRDEIEKNAFRNMGFAVGSMLNKVTKGVRSATGATPMTATMADGSKRALSYSAKTRVPLKKRQSFASQNDFDTYQNALRTPATKTQLLGQRLGRLGDRATMGAINNNNLITAGSNNALELIL